VECDGVNENIIAINVPNAVSIVLMAVVGTLLIGAIYKVVRGRGTSYATNTTNAEAA
jgi:hypothetical protein